MNRGESLVAVLAMILCVACPATRAHAAGRTYALLVGVSEYPALEPGLQLHGGPRNDVLLFRGYLEKRGVAADDIMVLTDGTPESALPTRAAIIEKLARLGEQAGEGDFVVLVFAGHGSQQPSKDDPRIEPDGLDEIFLPRDVGHWDGVPGTVQNAITDNEFGAAIGQIRSRGAFVWAVFDTCHSATMTRAMSVPGEQDREVTPAQLGIPSSVMDAARRKAAAAGSTESAAQGPRSTHGRLSPAVTAGPGGYVVFYSAQREERAPQKPLPAYSKQSELHGLFTFTLLQSLTTQPAATYRRIMERVLQDYQGLGIELTTPGYEGTALDAAVLGEVDQASDTQWPLRKEGERLVVEAGELQRVTPDSILAVVPDPTSTDAALLGYVRVVRSGLAAADVVPTQYAGKPAFQLGPKSVSAYTRPVDLKVDFTLHVGLPVAGKFCEAPGEALNHAIATIRADTQLAMRVDWVAANAAADVRLCKKSGRLLFLDGAGTLASSRRRSDNSLSLRASDAPPTPGSLLSPFAASLVDGLERIARVTNLYRIAAAMPGSDPGVKVVVDYCPGAGKSGFERCHPTAVTTESRRVFHDGDGIRVQLTNTSLQPVDVTVLHVNASYAITALFPDPEDPGEHARLPPRSKPVEFQVKLDATPAGFERLLVIAVPVKPESEEMSFVALAQDGLPARGTRGVSSGGLVELLDDAAFGHNTRGGLKTSDVSAAAISSFAWTVTP
jgi:hypothetical protein